MNQMLVIIGGIAGTGKTTLAINLMKTLHNKRFVFIDKDVIQDTFTENRDSNDYFNIRYISYKIIINLIDSNFKIGNNVLLVGPFNKFDDKIWNDIDLIVQKYEIDFRYVWCYADETIIKKRIINRGLSRDKWKLTHWKEFLLREPILPNIPFFDKYIKIDTSNNKCLKNVMKYLRK